MRSAKHAPHQKKRFLPATPEILHRHPAGGRTVPGHGADHPQLGQGRRTSLGDAPTRRAKPGTRQPAPPMARIQDRPARKAARPRRADRVAGGAAADDPALPERTGHAGEGNGRIAAKARDGHPPPPPDREGSVGPRGGAGGEDTGLGEGQRPATPLAPT